LAKYNLIMSAPQLLPVPAGTTRPRVSIVMPTYNRADYLRESAKMILAQSLSDLELIISDDHSTDHTTDVVAELIDLDQRVHYHRPDGKGGINRVLNEGISISKGYYIQICHDHDIYFPQLTEKLANVLDKHPTIVFAHPGLQGCDYLGNPKPKEYFVCGYPEISRGIPWKKKMLARLACPVTGLSMIRRSALEQIGLFDPEFGASSDIDMWMRLCEIGDVGYVNELLLYVRGRDQTSSYAGINWDLIDQVIRTHRKHLPRVYRRLPFMYWKSRRDIEIEMTLVFNYLNSHRHHWRRDIENGRQYLRVHGGIFSKGITYLL
jgi:glycosyltransferase involved in cell wall biosynthesis